MDANASARVRAEKPFRVWDDRARRGAANRLLRERERHRRASGGIVGDFRAELTEGVANSITSDGFHEERFQLAVYESVRGGVHLTDQRQSRFVLFIKLFYIKQTIDLVS